MMRTKALLFVCLQVFIHKEITAQCLGFVPSNIYSYYGSPNHFNYKPARETCDAPIPSFGRQLKMDSFNLPSPVISVSSEGLVISGAVSVSGMLPFLSSVSVRGELPTCGSGIVQFNSGDTEVDIIRELPAHSRTYPGPYSLISTYER